MADSAFGGNQDVGSTNPSFGIGGNMPVARPAQGDVVGLGEAAREIGANYAQMRKIQISKSLGQDLSDVNNDLMNVDNPVEQQIRSRDYRNKLLAKYGTDYVDQIDKGLQPRKLVQRYDPSTGFVRTIDQETGATVGTVAPSPDDAIRQHEINKIGVFSAEFPTVAKVGDSVFGKIQATGSKSSYADLQNIMHNATSGIDHIDRSMSYYHNLVNDPNISWDAKEQARTSIANDVTGNLISTLALFNNNTISNALSRGKALTPDAAMALPRAYMQDMLQHFQETGILTQLGIKTSDVVTLANAQMKTLEEAYKASFADHSALLQRAAVESQATVSLAKDKIWLGLPDNMKQISVLAPTMSAIAATVTATDAMHAQYETAPSWQKQIYRSYFGFLEGASQTQIDVGRLSQNHLESPDDLQDFVNVSREILSKPNAAMYFDDLRKVWQDRFPALQDLAKKSNYNGLDQIEGELKDYGGRLHKIVTLIARPEEKVAAGGGEGFWASHRNVIAHTLNLMGSVMGNGQDNTRPRPQAKQPQQSQAPEPAVDISASDFNPLPGARTF